MKKRLAAITAIVALGLGTFAAPASAETRTGSTSCSVGYRVTAFTELSSLGGGSGSSATHAYTSGGTTETYTVTGWGVKRSWSHKRTASWTLSSSRAFISYGAGCALDPV